MKCPICNGSGDIPNGSICIKDEQRMRRQAARTLYATKKYTYREIAKLLGWKSPRSVQLALEEEK